MEDENRIGNVNLHFTYDDSVCPEDACLSHADECYEKYVLPTLETFCRTHGTENLCMENLSVDLGRLLPEEIPMRLSEILEASLQQYIAASDTSDAAFPVPDAAEQLITYLMYEQVPWVEDAQAFNPESWWMEKAAGLWHDEGFLFRLHECCRQNVFALRRLFHLADASFFRQLDRQMEKIGNFPEACFSRLYAEKENIFPAQKERPEDVLEQYRKVYGYDDYPAVYDGLSDVENEKIGTDSFPEETIAAAAVPAMECIRTEMSSGPDNTDETGRTAEAPEKIFHSVNGRLETSDVFSMKDTCSDWKKDMMSEESVSQYFQHYKYFQYFQNLHYATATAGVVLLHPFLVNFFSRLDFLDERQHFKSLKKNMRAVHLLKYMSGYRGIHYSPCLVLEKLICGLPPAFPIGSRFRISKTEKQEVESLLSAVCQYWKPLQGTSKAGLQQSFLQRQGIIRHDGQSWVLHVESSAIDLLMDQLPWEISLLLLPWTEETLCVSWSCES